MADHLCTQISCVFIFLVSQQLCGNAFFSYSSVDNESVCLKKKLASLLSSWPWLTDRSRGFSSNVKVVYSVKITRRWFNARNGCAWVTWHGAANQRLANGAIFRGKVAPRGWAPYTECTHLWSRAKCLSIPLGKESRCTEFWLGPGVCVTGWPQSCCSWCASVGRKLNVDACDPASWKKHPWNGLVRGDQDVYTLTYIVKLLTTRGNVCSNEKPESYLFVTIVLAVFSLL